MSVLVLALAVPVLAPVLALALVLVSVLVFVFVFVQGACARVCLSLFVPLRPTCETAAVHIL